VAIGLGACGPSDTGSADAGTQAAAPDAVPTFTVDPSWPKELPNGWIMGVVTGVFVDARDHVWVTQVTEMLTAEETGAVQDPPISTCCAPAPLILEFDPEGTLVQAWGEWPMPSQGEGDPTLWPRNPHGIFVDHNDNVWIGTYVHHRVMKYTRDGTLLMTLGEYDVTGGSNDTRLLGGPSGIWVDPNTSEVFISDGYTNRRVIVFDGDTGAYLRHWGAYGEPPVDDYDFGDRDPDGPPPEQFSTVHGITGSHDGLIYVADRRGNRIQVFRQDGTFVQERIVAPRTLASGSAFIITLSPDPEQQWLYLADGTNHKVWIMRRSDLEIVGEFGRGGRQVGQFLRPHGMDVDSHGNLYVGEASTGRRVQRFIVSSGGR
jgi:sugar lactone lactonase YvrE